MQTTTPPVADVAEQELIGSAILDPYLIQEYRLDDIPPEAFYKEAHRHIWRAIQKLHWDDKGIDIATLMEELRASGTLEKAGQSSYLIGVMDLQGTAAHAHTHAQSVLEAYYKREAMAVLEQAYSRCANGATFDQVQTEVEGKLGKINRGDNSSLQQAIELAKGYLQNQARIPTGFPSLDHLTGGLPLGDLTVLAGRTSMGKSALAHAIAFKVGNAHVLTPDQPLPEIIVNEVCRRTKIPFDAIKRNALTKEHQQAWLAELSNVQKVLETDVTFDDRSLTVERLGMEVKRAAKRGKQLVVVDHIQRIRGGRYSRRELMIDVTGMLKDMARDYNISILALSQLARAIEERDSKVPTLADLSESKSIEEDANIVLFLYRDKYYHPNSPKGDLAEVILAKDKTGPRLATARLFFDSRFVLFREVSIPKPSN